MDIQCFQASSDCWRLGLGLGHHIVR